MPHCFPAQPIGRSMRAIWKAMLASVLSAFAGAAAAAPAFYELAASSKEALQYERAKELAISRLEAMTGLDEPMTAVAKQAAQQLRVAKFHVAADAEADRQCASVAASLFVLQTIPDTIFICADTR